MAVSVLFHKISPQYMEGSRDNKRPGIFYVPIVDVAKTSVDESIFLHEAIPKFRRYSGNAAVYTRKVYTERLGKELGMYTDPYQYMRALRKTLPVSRDTSIQSKKFMNRYSGILTTCAWWLISLIVQYWSNHKAPFLYLGFS